MTQKQDRMKHLRVLSLLLILFAGSSIVSADTCNYFTDPSDNSCVQKCLYPKVGDVVTQTCFSDDSYCKQFYNQLKNICLPSCPTPFKAQPAPGKNYQLCSPCPYQDSQGNCYQYCPPDLITDTNTNMCLNSPLQCKGVYIRDRQLCTNTCPYLYILDKTAIDPKICVSCKILGNCSSLINTNTNSNSGNNTNCALYLGADMQTCAVKCPPKQIALPQVKGQQYTQCQVCPDSTPYVSYDGTQCLARCDSGQVVDSKTLNCIMAQQCTTNLHSDSKQISWCVDKCPLPFSPQPVKGSNYNFCAQCYAGQYINLIDQKCVTTCDIVDATGKICLPSIVYCKGYISKDLTKCSNTCDPGQYVNKGNSDGQFICVDSCKSSQVIWQQQLANNQVQSQCTDACPVYYFAGDKNVCTHVDNCTSYLSIDGKSCLSKCAPGQIPQTVPNKKAQVCTPCFQKVSSDGKSCVADCGAKELYFVDNKQCLDSTQCDGIGGIKINGLCLSKCQPGFILQVDSSGNKSCISPSSCSNYISSDRLSCAKSCAVNEGVLTDKNLNFCVICPLGLDSDGKTCLKSCQTDFIYDVTAKSCVYSKNCSKMLSANGKRCVSTCEFPEVKPSSTATQCALSCATGQLYQDGVGCIDPKKCTGFQSANGKFCVQYCNSIGQIIDNTTSTPNTCKNCPDGQFPQVQFDKSILCIDKNQDQVTNIQDQLSNALKTSGGSTSLTPTQTETIKGLFQSITKDLEQQISQAISNSSQLNSLIQSGVSSLKNSVFSLLKQIPTQDASTNIDQANNQVTDQNQIILGSSTIQIIAEKQKPGFAFKIQFNLKDLIAGSSISLQQDSTQAPTFSSSSSSSSSSSLGIGNAKGQTDSTISAMQVAHLANHPYCSNCPTGLTTIDAKTSLRFRNLQSSSGSTFQMTYDVDPSQIQKTICVSYDSNQIMTVNPTSLDTTNNQITCTFTTNSSLYYDSTCEYVSKSLCSSSNSNNNSSSGFDASIVSSSRLLSASAALVITFLALF
ncbi:transmembrane protein, putative (macronuclear) [Tetrahymena thermophila SB210]|uniref:Transmembrane protein, putative n=1 Tax=Tetrahymena thermophila (strain SB210) TaxID=312017 RepID=Q22RC4_TETTS|nr:transmembrane protein, putative [Tetrahymena thermophila SB210]EAR88198.1 transmembrane protein, putative [Tetrahymena thermophila SB210]|eukprot:XP_001008443.1 transmembrane protein, putative [Tetrahymena thermophila SB210]